MMDESKQLNKKRSGQVMLEYVVALGICLAMVVMCALLLHGFKVFGGRVMSLVASFA